MVESDDPDQLVAMLAVAGLGLAAIWLLINWICTATPKPEPWGAEAEASLQSEDAVPVYHRCLTPHSHVA